jgi:hypothetical protein
MTKGAAVNSCRLRSARPVQEGLPVFAREGQLGEGASSGRGILLIRATMGDASW